MATQKQQSRREWIASNNSIEEINSGSLQRIADAVEVMSKSYVELTQSRDSWKRRCEQAEENNLRTWERVRDHERKMSALRGVITKLKKAVKPTAEDANV